MASYSLAEYKAELKQLFAILFNIKYIKKNYKTSQKDAYM